VLGANGIVADTTTYVIRVHTGDIKGAGTDANVYLFLYGEKGDSGRLELRKSETYRNAFERNRIDVFTRELMDIGNLKRVVVGHDNGGLLGGAWFLSKVRCERVSTGTRGLDCENVQEPEGLAAAPVSVMGYDLVHPFPTFSLSHPDHC
jgi:hypothetical protein